ncbi:unnamed protein product [Rhodiola kirilowii]
MSSVYGRLRGLFSNSRTATATVKSKRSPVVSRHERNLPTNCLSAVTDVGGDGVVTKRSRCPKGRRCSEGKLISSRRLPNLRSFGDGSMPYETIVRRLVTDKRTIEEVDSISLNEECSAIFHPNMPPKLGDPGSFSISCYIGGVNIERAMCDLGARISLMPYSLCKKLTFVNLCPHK